MISRTRSLPPALILLSVLVCPTAVATDATAPGYRLPAELEGEFTSAVVMDAETGDLLVEVRPHARHQPASMVKMMTELIVLQSIASGEIDIHDPVTVSAKASRMGGSQVYLKHGEVFTVEDLLMALAIHSANDAAVALAEHHSGTVAAFVDLMNMRAREMGMNDTEFHSVHGLPPGPGQQPDLSSAYDMALLGRALTRYPEALLWGATASAPFREGEFTLYNPNRLVGRFRGLDGIKTGFHEAAGYCVTASAVQKDRRLIAVVMGAPDDQARAREASRLLTFGFNLFTHHTLVDHQRDGLEPLKVKDGKARQVALAYAQSLTLCVRKDQLDAVVMDQRVPEAITAPVSAGQVVGKAVAMLDGRALGEVEIVAAEDVAEGSFFEKLFH